MYKRAELDLRSTNYIFSRTKHRLSYPWIGRRSGSWGCLHLQKVQALTAPTKNHPTPENGIQIQ